MALITMCCKAYFVMYVSGEFLTAKILAVLFIYGSFNDAVQQPRLYRVNKKCSVKLSDTVIHIEKKLKAYTNVSEMGAFQNYGPFEFLDVLGQYSQNTLGYSACISTESI